MRNLARSLCGLTLLGAACGLPADDEALASASAEVSVAQVTVAPIHAGNALTLPAQRHMALVGGTYLLALQQGGAGGHGLGFFRSDDGARSWRYFAPIQDDWTHSDTADLVVAGSDVALVYSYEGPTLAGSTAHDVYFQLWRHEGADWVPSPRVRVFDSGSDATGYYRAELARDSWDRWWVQAFKLESNGSSTARIAVSTDGGLTFAPQPILASLSYRGGGRLIALGDRLLFIYDGHEAGRQPARQRIRDDAQPVTDWGPATFAFGEGIYHGAALSAVADGDGGLHLVYKDKSSQSLWYRRFDGSAFGARTLVDDSGTWELQSAATRIGDDLEIFYNRGVAHGAADEANARLLHQGMLGDVEVLDGSAGFKGYPAAPETLPAGSSAAPCVFGVAPDQSSRGNAVGYSVGVAASGPTTLFADDFARSVAPDGGLVSPFWSVGAGRWFVNGHAESDRDATNRVTETAASCADCRVEATIKPYGVPETSIFLRASSPDAPDRYEILYTGSRDVVVRRVAGSVAVDLGRAPSGNTGAIYDPVRLALSAAGAAPVTLTAWVNGRQVLQITDGSTDAPASGYAGLYTNHSGVSFDDFALIR